MCRLMTRCSCIFIVALLACRDSLVSASFADHVIAAFPTSCRIYMSSNKDNQLDI
jgi:hypothetical protein